MTQTWIGKDLIEAVRLERERDPQAIAADIARHLNKSREAIRQALMKLGLPTKFAVARGTRFCINCGKKLCWGSRTDRHRRCFIAPGVEDAVVRDYLRGNMPAAIKLKYKISSGVMYRILHKRNVNLKWR